MTPEQADDIQRRETTLWRLIGRYDEAARQGDAMAMLTLEAGFLRRLKDYERICDACA